MQYTSETHLKPIFTKKNQQLNSRYEGQKFAIFALKQLLCSWHACTMRSSALALRKSPSDHVLNSCLLVTLMGRLLYHWVLYWRFIT